MAKNEYKKTTNLPSTGFPMRASLAQNEPKRLAAWEEAGVYELMLKKNEGHDKFVLHDGPPYANGPIHLGHAQNKISKDIINRYWSMRGYQTPYVPGWDCHGQPIEHKVETMLGTEKFNQLPTEMIRELCRKMAVEQVDTQRQGFKRLGVLGEWDNPYLTYVNDYDATDIEIFKAIFDAGAIVQGSKPVHWCSHCHTALAEAEIEYGDEVSPAIFVRFEMTTVPEGLEEWAGRLFVDIWTTTPWTLPADDAVILHPEATYVALAVDGRAEIVAEALAARCAAKFGYGEPELVCGPDGEPWRATGEALAHNRYKQPIFADQGETGEFIYADYVTLDDGTGIVHCAPGHGVDDYLAGQRFGIPTIMPVDDDGRFFVGDKIGTGGPWSGMEVNEANPQIIAWLEERGTLILHEDINHSYPHCWRCKEPVIFRATSQWFVSMDKPLRGGKSLREQALEELSKVAFYPSHAIKRIGSMVEGRPDWCILGRAHPGLHLRRLRRHGHERRHPRRRDRALPHQGLRLLVHRRPGELPRRGLRLPGVRQPPPQGQPRHPGRLVGLRRLPHRRLPSPRQPQVPCGHVPRGLRPAPRLVHELAHDLRGRLRRGAVQVCGLPGLHP